MKLLSTVLAALALPALAIPKAPSDLPEGPLVAMGGPSSTAQQRRGHEKARDSVQEMHYAGMNPHHNAGRDPIEQSTFRHRYSYYHPQQNKLLYFEYMAKRHPHVTILDETALEACSSTANGDGNYTVHLLIKPDKYKVHELQKGSILVVNEQACTMPNGHSKTNVLDRIVKTPTVTAHSSGNKLVSALIKPAGVHECFEHSTTEYFHGEPHHFRASREQRMASLEKLSGKSGHVHPFASTEAVLHEGHVTMKKMQKAKYARADARRQERRRARTERLKRLNQTRMAFLSSSSSPGASSSSAAVAQQGMRQLDADGYVFQQGDSCDDLDMELVQVIGSDHCDNEIAASKGTEAFSRELTDVGCKGWKNTNWCSVTGPRQPQYDKSCHEEISSGASGYCECSDGSHVGATCHHATWKCEDICAAKLGCTVLRFDRTEELDSMNLQAGQKYLFSWKYNGDYGTNRKFKIVMMEKDFGFWNPNEGCGALKTVEYGSGSIPLGNNPGAFHSVTIIVPEQDDLAGCTKNENGGQGFPEYILRLEEIESDGDTCEIGDWPDADPNEFRLLTSEEIPISKQFNKNFEWTGSKEYEGGAATYAITCTDCGATVEGSIHTITRTSNFNPFEEMWANGHLTIKGLIDFRAEVSATFAYDEDREIFEQNCASPVCVGGKLAGIEIKLGLMFGLAANAKLEFEMQLIVTYKKLVVMDGDVVAHALLSSSGGFEKSFEKNGFKPKFPEDDDGTNQGPDATLEISALAQVTLSPEIKVGLFANAWEKFTAEASATATANLIAQVDFNYKKGLGSTDRAKQFVLPALSQGDSSSCPWRVDDSSSDQWGVNCCKQGGGLPLCVGGTTQGKPVCAVNHNMQLDLQLMADLTFYIRIYAAYDFGPWEDELLWERWLTPNGLVEEEAVFKEYQLHILSLCFGVADYQGEVPEGGEEEEDEEEEEEDENVVVENAPDAGTWGGKCTCPNGGEYWVGDNNDFCGSLACVGGESGTCNREHGDLWKNRKVVCADAPVDVVEENAPGVGTWGGKCTCPNGVTYWAGDNNDFCGSLACEGGGTSGTCQRKTKEKWKHKKVICGGTNAQPKCQFKEEKKKYMADYTNPKITKYSLSKAIAACEKRKDCNGITKQSNGAYSGRKSGRLVVSDIQEKTWVKSIKDSVCL